MKKFRKAISFTLSLMMIAAMFISTNVSAEETTSTPTILQRWDFEGDTAGVQGKIGNVLTYSKQEIENGKLKIEYTTNVGASFIDLGRMDLPAGDVYLHVKGKLRTSENTMGNIKSAYNNANPGTEVQLGAYTNTVSVFTSKFSNTTAVKNALVQICMNHAVARENVSLEIDWIEISTSATPIVIQRYDFETGIGDVTAGQGLEKDTPTISAVNGRLNISAEKFAKKDVNFLNLGTYTLKSDEQYYIHLKGMPRTTSAKFGSIKTAYNNGNGYSTATDLSNYLDKEVMLSLPVKAGATGNVNLQLFMNLGADMTNGSISIDWIEISTLATPRVLQRYDFETGIGGVTAGTNLTGDNPTISANNGRLNVSAEKFAKNNKFLNLGAYTLKSNEQYYIHIKGMPRTEKARFSTIKTAFGGANGNGEVSLEPHTDEEILLSLPVKAGATGDINTGTGVNLQLFMTLYAEMTNGSFSIDWIEISNSAVAPTDYDVEEDDWKVEFKNNSKTITSFSGEETAISATIKYLPATTINDSYKVIIASYESNELIDVRLTDITFAGNGLAEVTTPSLSSDGATIIKLFVWDGFDMCVPVTDVNHIEYVANEPTE